MQKGKIDNILIIKIAAIGDLLLITPSVRIIRRNFPQAKIALLVGRWSRPIIEGNPNIDEIIEVSDEIFFKIRPFSLLKLILSLRRRHFDLAFVWHRSLAFRFFGWLAGARIRVGFSRKGNACFLTHAVEENPEIHEIFEYQSTLKPLGIESKEIDMDIEISGEDQNYSDELLKENGVKEGDMVIAVAPGGGKNPKEAVPLKHWPKEHYAELINMLDQKVVLLGNKDDASIIKDIISRTQGKVIDLSSKLSLKQLAAVIKRCRIFVGNDSAPMHIAAAVGTPVISIFGPTSPEELAPLDYKHIYFYAGEKCSPCYKNGRWPECSSRNCMYRIKPDQVLAAIKKLMRASDQKETKK